MWDNTSQSTGPPCVLCFQKLRMPWCEAHPHQSAVPAGRFRRASRLLGRYEKLLMTVCFVRLCFVYCFFVRRLASLICDHNSHSIIHNLDLRFYLLDSHNHDASDHTSIFPQPTPRTRSSSPSRQCSTYVVRKAYILSCLSLHRNYSELLQ